MATICCKTQVDQINIFTFMDDLVVDVLGALRAPKRSKYGEICLKGE